MKINIFDCRSRHLDKTLWKLGTATLSTLFPTTEQPLPSDIKSALQLYIINTDDKPTTIDIAMEVNEWIDKMQATELLLHMYALIEAFFAEQQHPLPACRLIISEHDQLHYLAPEAYKVV